MTIHSSSVGQARARTSPAAGRRPRRRRPAAPRRRRSGEGGRLQPLERQRPGGRRARSHRQPAGHAGQRVAGLRRPFVDLAAATRRTRRARRRAAPCSSAPSASQACPTNITSRCGRRSSASPRTRSGATAHSSSQLAHERVGRALAEVDRAAGAERPAAGPRGDPRSAPAGQPAAVRGARDAQRRHALRGVARDQPQRPAQRLHLDRDSVARPGCSRPAARRRRRGSASRAPAVRGSPRRRPRSCAAEGSKCCSRQRALDLLHLPRAAGEDLGRVCRGGGLGCGHQAKG